MIQLKTLSRISRNLALGVALAASLLLASCGGSSSTSTSTLKTITITPTTISIQVNGKTTFAATGLDASGTTVSNLTFTWASASTNVATIDTNGVVTGEAAGTSAITAASGGVTSSAATVTVTPSISSITVAPTSATIRVGATQAFTATALDSGGNAISGVTFNWGNSNGLLASINSSGVVTALAPGTVLITATSGGITSPAAMLTITN